MIFYDKPKNDQFELEGYASMPLLSLEDVEHLKQIYDDLGPPDRGGFHATIFTSDPDYRKKVDIAIKETVGDKLDNILINYRKLFANFMVKEPDPESESPIHQDASYVDETLHTGLQVWIPLTDVDEHNGAVCVVPGSHHIHNFVRGLGDSDPFRNLQATIKQRYCKIIPLNAGEALCWNHRLVHFSPPNKTKSKRLAVVLCMIPRTAQAIYHRVEKENKKERRLAHRYKVDSDFFMSTETHNKQKPSNVNKSVDLVNCYYPIVTEHKLKDVVTKIQSDKKSIWQKLKNFALSRYLKKLKSFRKALLSSIISNLKS